MLNIRTATQQFRGRLPLTPGSCLTWFGFSEEGHLSAFDSKVNLTLKLVLDTNIYRIWCKFNDDSNERIGCLKGLYKSIWR